MTDDKTPLTAAEIAELRRLEAAATKGPWEAISHDHGGIEANVMIAPGETDFYHTPANMLFIAALRNAAPRLLAAAEREQKLREKCTKIENEINAYLFNGGMFNPELANHDNVRDWLRGIAAALAETEEK